MAKKRAAPAPVPTADRVARAARAGDHATALDLARRLHALTPTADHLALLKRTLAAAAAAAADRDQAADFNRLLVEADQIDPADPLWPPLLARGGRLADALARADDAARPAVLGQAADRAVRLRSKDGLPDDLHPGYDAVIAAFRQHEAGDADAARGGLEPVGLRSPFLEWKVLLRGLLAHAAGDDPRAAEAFAKLDPARLPARLAAPLRAGVDAAYRAALPADEAGPLLAGHAKLTAVPAADALRAVAKELGRDKPLGPAFKAAEAAVGHLKTFAPDLVPKLATVLYHAVIAQGQPNDLTRLRTVFGPPPDDPQFHRLQALVGEQVGDPAGAHAHWRKYEGWLAGGPAGWPDALRDRARAMVWARMGDNARRAAADADGPELPFGPRRRKPKPLDPPAADCFARAAGLAPDWPDAGRKLFDAHLAADDPAAAEAAGRQLLDRRPDDLPTLIALAGLLQRQGRAADAIGFWLRTLAVNPLDKAVRFHAAGAVLADARQRLADPAAAAAALDRHADLLAEQTPAAGRVLRSVILVKLKQPDEAAAVRAEALAVPGGRVGAAYRVMVDSLLAKLKPADKKAADKLFADELARPPTPWEVNQLIAAYDAYHVDGVTFRGQKGHDKKVLDQVMRCLDATAPEVDFERLSEYLLLKQEWKHARKLADALIVRFPANPYFQVARAEAGLETGEREYHVEYRLNGAKRLAAASAEPRHRALLVRIDRLLKAVAPRFDFLDAFFGRG